MFWCPRLTLSYETRSQMLNYFLLFQPPLKFQWCFILRYIEKNILVYTKKLDICQMSTNGLKLKNLKTPLSPNPSFPNQVGCIAIVLIKIHLKKNTEYKISINTDFIRKNSWNISPFLWSLSINNKHPTNIIL